jgi:hypothetical protein
MQAKKDETQAELDARIYKDINAMPAEVADRFKAIAVSYDGVDRLTEEEQLEHRALELKYEKLYSAVYEKRAALLRGDKDAVDQALIDKFDERAAIFKDEESFPPVDVDHVEVKDIQNIPFGVPSFWLKAMCNNKQIGPEVFEKDRPILSYLQDIELKQHEEDYGFDLVFKFEKNAYFNQTELKK